MTWDPPGLWASLILSISGGVVAGLIVLAGEVAIRWDHNRRQRQKGIRAIAQLFKEWETTINGAAPIAAQGNVPSVPKANVQFAFHEHYLRRAPNLIARWSRFLSADQVREVNDHLEGHQGAVIGILPQRAVLPQTQYDQFFDTARAFDWLDF